MYFIFTAEKPDGELHVRDGEGLGRGHVLPATGGALQHVPDDGGQALQVAGRGHRGSQVRVRRSLKNPSLTLC